MDQLVGTRTTKQNHGLEEGTLKDILRVATNAGEMDLRAKLRPKKKGKKEPEQVVGDSDGDDFCLYCDDFCCQGECRNVEPGNPEQVVEDSDETKKVQVVEDSDSDDMRPLRAVRRGRSRGLQHARVDEKKTGNPLDSRKHIMSQKTFSPKPSATKVPVGNLLEPEEKKDSLSQKQLEIHTSTKEKLFHAAVEDVNKSMKKLKQAQSEIDEKRWEIVQRNESFQKTISKWENTISDLKWFF